MSSHAEARSARPPELLRPTVSIKALAGGVAVGASVNATFTSVAAVPDQLASAYGVGLATIGLFTTALIVVHALLQIPGGNAVDRFGARRAGILAALFTAACSGAAALAAAPWLAFATRALSGLGTGLGFLAGSDYVRAAGGSPVAQGLFGGGSMAGGGLALAVVPQLEPLVGWRAPFLFSAGCWLGAALILLLAPADAPRPDRKHTRVTALDLLGDRRLYRLSAMYAAALGLGFLASSWVVALLVRQGHGSGAAGAIGALTLALNVLSRPLGGWLLQHRPGSTRPSLAAGLVAGSLGCAGLAAGWPTPAAVLCASAVGIGSGFAFAPAFTGAARVRPDAPGAAVGLVNMWPNVVAVVGIPLIGLTFSLPGHGRIGFLLLAGLWLAALLALPTAHELGTDRAMPSPVRSPHGAP